MRLHRAGDGRLRRTIWALTRLLTVRSMGVRTTRYTYVRDLNGPWLLYDNQIDPCQTNNLANQPKYSKLQSKLEAALARKLKERHDEFLPGDAYIKKWGYEVDANGTVPYKP